jgi:hypothetical protein
MARQHIRRLPEMMSRFLLPWGAYVGLFTSTSNCPCCGQPACLTGAAGMGIFTGLLAAVTEFFAKSGLLLLLCAFALYACAHTAQYQAESNTTDGSIYEGIIRFYRGPLNRLQAVRSGECPTVTRHQSFSDRSGIENFSTIMKLLDLAGSRVTFRFR